MDGNNAAPDPDPDPARGTCRAADGRAISFFGDLHPSFSGNVVKAMASAKQGYPVVSRVLSRLGPSQNAPETLVERLNNELRPVVQDVIRLTPNIVEIVVRAPIAARAFKPPDGCLDSRR